MKLVVFDLDGTLTRTYRVDGECFVLAVSEAVQLTALDRKWDDYEHVTDEGILRELFSRRFGRLPAAHESTSIADRFMDLLTTRHGSDASDFAEVAGAQSFVRHLREQSSWGIAIATGAWRRSADFKIHRAQLPLTNIPSAFAEDGPSREAIVRTAIQRAATAYGESEFERIVSVGDALWDVKTARNLGLPFLGVASGARAGLLRDNGASHVIEDYSDTEQCLRYMEEAQTP